MPVRLGSYSVLLALGTVTAGCGGSGTSGPEGGETIAITLGASTAPAGTALAADPVVLVADANGSPMAGAALRIAVQGGGWVSDTFVTTSRDGRASVAWYLGPDPDQAQKLTVTTATASQSASADALPLEPGRTIMGRNGYVEFQTGDAPVILSAGHGGLVQPAEIPDRTDGTTVTDTHTQDLARRAATALRSSSGQTPWLVISHLQRIKLDPNRELAEAAGGNPYAARAWREYHGYLEAARHAVTVRWGRGLYLDLHGHGHTVQRLELGYLLGASTLALPDSALDAGGLAASSSIRALAGPGGSPLSVVLRGSSSLGGLLEQAGYPSVPSPTRPHPAGDPYFNGGYSTARHGSRDGGRVSGIQIEANWERVRDTEEARGAFATGLATAVGRFLGSFPAESAGPDLRRSRDGT
jgi:hypothetical protein